MTPREQSLPRQVELLQQAIKVRYGCASTYSQTRYVHERCGAGVGFGALVYLFRLIGHPQAKCCYAWKQRDGSRSEIVTVLQLAPVDSAELAVRHFAAGIGAATAGS